MKTAMTTKTIDPQTPSLEAIPDLETTDPTNDDAPEVATVDTSHFLHDARLVRYAAGALDDRAFEGRSP
jgi:hypothetical protein